jgi:hypothetical protein
MSLRPGEPPEITRAARAASVKLTDALARDAGSIAEEEPLKGLLLAALEQAFSQGALYVFEAASTSLADRMGKGRRRYD